MLIGNGCGIQGQNYAALLQGSGMLAGFHSKNLILGICFTLLNLNVFQWSSGEQIRAQVQWSEIISWEERI